MAVCSVFIVLTPRDPGRKSLFGTSLLESRKSELVFANPLKK